MRAHERANRVIRGVARSARGRSEGSKCAPTTGECVATVSQRRTSLEPIAMTFHQKISNEYQASPFSRKTSFSLRKKTFSEVTVYILLNVTLRHSRWGSNFEVLQSVDSLFQRIGTEFRAERKDLSARDMLEYFGVLERTVEQYHFREMLKHRDCIRETLDFTVRSIARHKG